MDDLDILVRLGLALAIGLLFGLERGWHGRGLDEGGRIAGIRTFALTGLLGGVCGWLAALTSPVLLALGLLALGALLAVSYRVRMAGDHDLGLTTEVALLLVFGLGAASVLGPMAPVAAVAAVATLLLSMKASLHRWIAAIGQMELRAVVLLAVLSVAVLPFLPDRGFGPGRVLNPYELWWAVVIVAGLSFLGYLAIRLAGVQAGILLTGLFGGLASSTSTTLALARLVHGQDGAQDGAPGGLAPIAAAGTVLAGAVTYLRILALVAIFAPALLAPLALPMGVMAATGLAGAGLLARAAAKGRAVRGEIAPPANPMELTAALVFGLLLAAVVLGTYYLRDWLGTTGIFVAAALSALTDVDALTISVSRLVQVDLPVVDGTVAIFIATAVNTAVKGGIALVAGNARLGGRVLATYGVVIAAGAVALWSGM